MSNKIELWFADVESCGLHGVPVILQYAIHDGPVNVHHLWTEPIDSTLDLIEHMVDGCVIAHNIRFDWFHISKFYNMLNWICKTRKSYERPIDLPIELMAEAEWQSQFGPCLKPAGAVDTLLLASKGEDQSFLMDMKAIYVRRVPVGLADPLCDLLNASTNLPWIIFAGKKDQSIRWTVIENKDRRTGEVDPYWNDIKLSFRPSKSLKDLAKFLCHHEPSARFHEIAFEVFPAEEGFAPFAKLLSSKDKEWLYPIRKKHNGKVRVKLEPTWPGIIHEHIQHWANDKAAMEYAVDDITMLRKLYHKLGAPNTDEDSIVACQVANVRLRGFSINVEGVKKLKEESQAIISQARINVNSPQQVAGFVAEALDDMEQFMLKDGCNQKIIDEIKNEFSLTEIEECYCDGGQLSDEVGGTKPCPRCEGRGSVGPTGKCDSCGGTGHTDELENGKPAKCKPCNGTGLSEDRKMPVVRRVEHIETVRKHKKRIELFDKLLLAGRAYPDFNVIGTKSGRMSGASGLNFQGIDHSDAVRSLFTLADAEAIGLWDCEPGSPLVLSAGDYASQELAIAATAMQDDELMRDMESGKKLHGLFAAQAFETTYEDIMENQDDGRYGKGKGGVFAILYGGTFQTVAKNMGIEVEVAEAAYNRMVAKYPQMGNTRKKISERFSSMEQDSDGKITYRDPPEKFIESVFGFRRYFETEYEIQRMILSVIKNMPQEWKDLDIRVERKSGKLQSISGALCSALYGAAFSIQNKVIRASNNHVIQSTGRHLTVGMQHEVWKLQPQGIHPFRLTLMSIHDELAVVSPEQVVPEINEIIENKVNEQCLTVPLTCIEWFNYNRSWAEKGHGQEKNVYGWKP